MDEILIGEKKYISSKQAAKATGYAKDYIGQLCREGRVPARLVGRSWYVLESAIHDHRFGEQNAEQLVQESAAPEVLPTWESPRYEAESPAEDILPSVQRTEEVEGPDTQHLHDSWKEWFDRIADASMVAPPVSEEGKEELKEEKVDREAEEAEEVPVPIHAVYHKPPEEFLPRRAAKDRYDAVPEPELQIMNPYEPEEVQEQRVGKAWLVLQTAGGLFAVVIAVLAVLGTGYFDEYIISNNQVNFMAGVALYDR